MFEVSQKVVYPLQGVGEVRGINRKEFRGRDIHYYQIYFPVSDMTFMVPVDHIETLNIRPVACSDQAQEALEALEAEAINDFADWKKRYEINRKLLKSGDIVEVARVFKLLYSRAQRKELPIQEKKLYDSAKAILENELSLSLALPEDEIRQCIMQRLGKDAS